MLRSAIGLNKPKVPEPKCDVPPHGLNIHSHLIIGTQHGIKEDTYFP